MFREEKFHEFKNSRKLKHKLSQLAQIEMFFKWSKKQQRIIRIASRILVTI